MVEVSALSRRIRDAGADIVAGVRRAVRYVGGRWSTGGQGALVEARMSAAAAVDELLLTTFQILRSPPDDGHFAARLDEAQQLLDHLGRALPSNAAPERLHVRPEPARLAGPERRVGHVGFRHATFPSPYLPSSDIPGAIRFREQTGNALVHAWMLDHERPAPWVVCIHGAGMGDPLADIFAFRAGALHRAGFNVAIPVLPHHGPRGTGRMSVAFPTDDPVLNFHGAAQAVADVRAVLAAIEQRGEPAMLMGISLGAYVAASVAALEPTVRAVVVGVPVTDLSALIRRHAPERFARHPLFEALCDVSSALEQYGSPLTLPVPEAHVRRVWAGRADRLVQPDQVERIIERWGTEDPMWYQGGHVGFLGLPGVHRYIRRAVVDAGLGERQGRRVLARNA